MTLLKMSSTDSNDWTSLFNKLDSTTGRYCSLVALLSSFHLNVTLKGNIQRIKFIKTLYNIINSTTEKHCSVRSFPLIANSLGFLSQTQKLEHTILYSWTTQKRGDVETATQKALHLNFNPIGFHLQTQTLQPLLTA